jgi:hypothetical protein
VPRVRAKFNAACLLTLAIVAPRLAVGAEAGARRARQHASLRYERGPGSESCPPAAALRRAVEVHLGYDPFDDSARLEIRCQIVVRRARLVAVVNVSNPASGRSGERKLVATNMNCTELADAAALAIAIAIDPLLPAASAAPEVTDPPRDEAARVPSPIDESPTTSPKPAAVDRVNHEKAVAASNAEGPNVPLLFSIGAGASLSYALQPSAALGATLAFAARRGPLGLALEAQWRPPSHLSYLSGTVTAQLFSAALLGCGHHGVMNACFLVDAGIVAGSAEGYLRSARDTTPFLATGARIAWQPSVFRNGSALVYVAGLVPLVRTTLWIDPQSVWTMSHLAAQTGLLGFFAFP